MMRPRTARAWDRTLAGLSVGALAAAGILWAAEADAATVLAAEGLMQRPGTTQQAFGGAFCEHHTCKSVNNPTGLFTAFSNVPNGAAKVAAAVGATDGPVTVIGWSLGAASIQHQLLKWAEKPETAPAVDRLRIVTFGAPEPTSRDRDRAAVAPVPEYEHLSIVAQYDQIADKPTRWGWYSMLEVSLSQHMSYDEADINDPGNLVYRDGNTTHMLIPAAELRQLRGLRWLRDIGWVTPERYDEVDAERRARIEQDFDRPDFRPQGEGADWANGIEPEGLRDASDVQPDAGTDESENPEARRELDVDLGSRDSEGDEDSDRREDRLSGDVDGLNPGRGGGNEQSEGTEPSSGAKPPNRSADQDSSTGSGSEDGE